MARTAAAQALSEESIRALLGACGPTGPLPSLFLCLPNREDGMAVRVAAFLIRLRSGGFMVALPDIEEAAHFLQAQETEAGMEAAAALFAANVMMETPRGRALEEASILFADLIWPLATLFMRGSPLRAPSMVEALKFQVGEQPARPNRGSLETAADQWIHETMDEDTAADYVTVDGGLVEEEEEPPDVVEGLQRRVQELEALLSQQPVGRPTQAATSSMTPETPPRGILFNAVPNRRTQVQTMATLRQLAGTPPPRLGTHERAVREAQPGHFLETLQQEENLEAVGAPEMEEGLQELEAAVVDPLQRMLLMQMKQLQILSKQ